MPLITLEHPLAQHVLARLRDKATEPAQFRVLCHQISLLLLLEATRDLRMAEVRVETPLETHLGKALAQPLVAVPILRAGLGMLQPIVDLFPDVSVGYIGLERDHDTALARSYYCKLPPVENARVLLVDPMLATGGSAVKALDVIMQRGATDVCVLNIVAAPEGVNAVHAAHPAVRIFTGALDRELNARKYILPGLGDFGDRLYGT
jgi:uracil phosphoribosyltransferase